MIQNLRKNIEAEIAMARELASFYSKAAGARPDELRILQSSIRSLINRMRIVNDTIPHLVREISLTKKLPEKSTKTTKLPEPVKTPEITPVEIDEKRNVLVKGVDKREFMKELDIAERLLRKKKRKELKEPEEVFKFKRPSFYGKLANKFFLSTTENWVSTGRFKSLGLDIRRSNMNVLTTTYLSMMLLSIILFVFVGIAIMVFFLFFSLGIEFPYLTFYHGDYVQRFIQIFWIPILLPLLAGISFYFFPGAERKSLAKKIDQELPFVVIHMGSISGSGIEPSKIFKIMGLSKDYKYAGKEIRKILNQTNIYGYDLTTALRNVALSTPSPKLSELLNGISVTINSGGDIKTFFEKRADSLLLEYRLEREKFTKTAETFMDVYISIVIAAPMILLMLLIMIAVSGISSGLSLGQMTIAIIGIVTVINILFLTFLQIKQPGY